MNRCVYCKSEVPHERTMQICDICGCKVWGKKMFMAILQGTDNEREKGNMELGRVSEQKEAGSIQEMHKIIGNSRVMAR